MLSPALQEERLDSFIGWQATDAEEKNKRQRAWQRVLYTESLDDEAMAKTALSHTAKLLGEAQVWGDTHKNGHDTSSQHADQMICRDPNWWNLDHASLASAQRNHCTHGLIAAGLWCAAPGLDRLTHKDVDLLALQPPHTPAAAPALHTEPGTGQGAAGGSDDRTAGGKTSANMRTARKQTQAPKAPKQTPRKRTSAADPAAAAAAATSSGAALQHIQQQMQRAYELLPASLPGDDILERFTVPEDDPRRGLRGQDGVRLKASASGIAPGAILAAYGNYCMPQADNQALQQQAPAWLQEKYRGCHPAAARKAWELCLEVGPVSVRCKPAQRPTCSNSSLPWDVHCP